VVQFQHSHRLEAVTFATIGIASFFETPRGQDRSSRTRVPPFVADGLIEALDAMPSLTSPQHKHSARAVRQYFRVRPENTDLG
jgi:hypothetical protein